MNQEEDKNHFEDHSKIGIILLELCLGRLSRDHPIRQSFPVTGADKRSVIADDVAAAIRIIESDEIGDEAGKDFENAISWCLLGYRSAVRQQNTWAKEFFSNVIQPLTASQIKG